MARFYNMVHHQVRHETIQLASNPLALEYQ